MLTDALYSPGSTMSSQVIGQKKLEGASIAMVFLKLSVAG